MIGFLRGDIAAISDDSIIIDVGGVGYNVLMPAGHIMLLPGIGSPVKIYTHLSVREDAMTLFGFLTADDLAFFRMLIGVSGVGPKYALGMLSTFDVNDLRMAIMSMDAKTLTKAPGIGLKSAQKIILEIKDKISMDDILKSSKNVNISENTHSSMTEAMSDATEALTALGYSATEALRAIRECDASEEDDVEAVIKKALKVMKR